MTSCDYFSQKLIIINTSLACKSRRGVGYERKTVPNFVLFVFYFSKSPAVTHMRGLGAAILEFLARGRNSLGARVGHASKDECDPAFIPCTERSLCSPYNYLAQNLKMGPAHHHPKQKSTASPFVATFPATNLLVSTKRMYADLVIHALLPPVSKSK